MLTYTEIYNNGQGIKDISASRYYYLSECLNYKIERKLCKRKTSFMRKYQKQNFDYIVYNPFNSEK
jgi:hypothetical protein